MKTAMVRTDFVRRTMAVFAIFHENKIFSEACKKTALFDGYLSEGLCTEFMKSKKISD